MAVATFDTLKYAKALRAAGVPESQAEAHSAALSEAMSVNLKDLVTKDDLKIGLDTLRYEISGSIDVHRHETKEMEQRLNSRMDVMQERMKLIQWMLGVGLLGTLTMVVRMFLSKPSF